MYKSDLTLPSLFLTLSSSTSQIPISPLVVHEGVLSQVFLYESLSSFLLKRYAAHKPEEYVSVKDAIGDMEKIKSGESSKKDFMHRAAKLSD